MPRPKDPFRGKRRPGDKAVAQSRKGKGKKKGNKAQRSFWGFVGAVGAAAAACVGVLLQQRSQRAERDAKDAAALARIRRLPLLTTEHAACRMDCRFVPQQEVDEALATGHINHRKSDLELKPCAKYVIDGQVGPDHKNVQVVVSACPEATTLITVIDLDSAWEACYCP